jgi:hypothetical protein
MNGKTRWLLGGMLAFGLLVGSVVATGVNAQTAPAAGTPGAGVCPGPAMMGGGLGFGAPGVAHDAVAAALGISSQELRDAQAAGKSIAAIAQERQVDLGNVVDAALAAHAARLAAAVKDGTLTQAQADAMQAMMKTRIENGFQGTAAGAPRGFGMGGRGMMGPGAGRPWRTGP